jgi:hypothetical protein
MRKRMGAQGRGDAGTPRAWARLPPRTLPALACLVLLLLAPTARATFHEISIREVYPGGADDASYVELQMWASGQHLVKNHHLVAYDSAGSVIDDFAFAANVASGADQATILVADTGYPTAFDERPLPDGSDEGLNLPPAGGAVCWLEGAPPDCVAWGNFKGPLPAHLPALEVGDPASPGGVTAGKALRRSIAKGCSTLLDPPPTDDSDDSATDFGEVEPEPRDNATAPVEKECLTLPNTSIATKPANPTKSTAASFTYTSPDPEAGFECRLDGDEGPFAGCLKAGVEYAGPLADGIHGFEVRAVNSSGADPTPALYEWRVDTEAPTVTITEEPEDPSPGASVSFKYQSSETGSKFECSLAKEPEAGGFSACPATGKTYTGLANGRYAFAVRATDAAQNLGAPASFAWTVSDSAADKTPPETTLGARPADPSESSTASFTYSSNEPGSSFECALDGAAFAPCPAPGIAYTGLGSGPHSFQVRAIDPSGNVDPTPAGYSFQVVLAAVPLRQGPSPAPPRPALDTRLLAKPPARTRDRTPTFRFDANQPGASFECRLDRRPFKACRSPLTTKPLSYARHAFSVRAVLGSSHDSTPVTVTFKELKPK